MGGGVPRRLRAGRPSGADRRPSPFPSRRNSTGSSCSTTTMPSCAPPSSGTTPSPPRTPARSSPLSPAVRPRGRTPAAASRSRASPSPSCTGCGGASPRPSGGPPPCCSPTTGSRSGSPAGAPRTGAMPPAPGTGRLVKERYREDLLRLVSDDVDWDAALPDVLAPDAVAGEWRGAGIPVAAGTGDNMAAALGLGLRPGDLALSLGTSGDRVHGLGRARRPIPPARWPASPMRPGATCRWSAP